MTIELTDLRTSFIWADTILDPFKEEAHLAVLGQRFAFAPLFEKARSKPVKLDVTLGLSLSAPWPKPTGQRFWQSYLGGVSLASVSGEQAWKSLTPMRAKVPFAISTSLTEVVLSFDAYFYPHGLALAANARFSQKLPLESIVAEVFRLRRDAVVSIQLPGGESETKTLDAVADRILNELRDYAWGKGSSGWRTAPDPFSVLTVVRGTGATGPVAPESDLHRALEAVANWRVSWKHDELPPLDKARLTSRNPPLEDNELMYSGKRGRVVWSPAVFGGPAAVATLACYHRNLTQASLQTESLCGLARQVAKKIAGKETLRVAVSQCAQNAAGILGRLYGGDSSVYRSWSVRAQIERGNFTDDINVVRKYFNMAPLS